MVYRLFGSVKRADAPEGFVEIPCEIEPGILCREPGLLGKQTGKLGKPTGNSGRELEGRHLGWHIRGVNAGLGD